MKRTPLATLLLWGCISLVFVTSASAVPLAVPAQGRIKGVSRFALVIGNNRPENPKQPWLRYADDDAVATHQLLQQAGVHSVLLVTLDGDSRRLYPRPAARGAPRFAVFSKALADLVREMRAARARGQTVEFLFFFSGHGDVARGEGYILLEDRRLTRTLLYKEVLNRVPAHHNHVLVDACKSYYLAFERGPGGRRSAYTRSFVRSTVPARLANTGFVLSTSSDKDSHEWERYQAGVFSHEVRSALRGAADSDGDGQVTYAELGAFLKTANESISNPRFRPDFVVRPPGHPRGKLSQPVLSWGRRPATVVLDQASLGHVYLEGAQGERILDAHAEPGQSLVLHAPGARPLFVRRNDESAEYVITGRGEARLSELKATSLQVARKGALHLAFERLFFVPFSQQRVAAFSQSYERMYQTAPAPHLTASFDIGRTVQIPFPTRRTVGVVAGWTAIGAAAAGLSMSFWAIERYQTGKGASQQERAKINSTLTDINTVSIVCYSIAGAAGIAWLVTRLWPSAPRFALAPAPTTEGAGLTLGGLF